MNIMFWYKIATLSKILIFSSLVLSKNKNIGIYTNNHAQIYRYIKEILKIQSVDLFYLFKGNQRFYLFDRNFLFQI